MSLFWGKKGVIYLKKLTKTDYVILVVLLALIAFIVLMVTRGGKTEQEGTETAAVAEQEQAAPKELKISDYAGKKIGIQTGTIFDEMVKDNIPDAEISYYNSYTDLLSALKANIIDGFAGDEPIVKYMMVEDSSVDYIKDYMDNYSFGFAFPKTSEGEALCNEFSDYINKIKSDGTLDGIDSIWFGTDDSLKTIPDLASLSGSKGKLSLALESANAPFVYTKNNEIVGYEVDVAYRFCEEYGYGLELVDMNFDGIIPAVSSGKQDFGCSTITITEERRESVNFSDPHYDGGSVIAVRKADLEDATASSDSGEAEYKKYDGQIMGIRTGTNFEQITFDYFPNSEYMYFETESDMVTALKGKKINGYLADEPVAAMCHVEQPEVNFYKKPIMDDDYYFAFQKDTEKSKKLRTEFNEILAELKANGELDHMKEKWIGKDDSIKTVDESGLTGENGELVIAVVADYVPFSYTLNNKLVGYAIELSYIFAREYGYSIRFEQTTITSCLTGLSTGKYDMIASSLSYTEERAQSIDYSDVIYNGGVVLVVRSSDLDATGNNDVDEGSSEEESEKKGFIDSIKFSFERNFIREQRYKLVFEGIRTTCIITILAVIFGSLLAFLICLFRRFDSVLADMICNLYVKILQGTPIVVLLMILYYVIFGNSGIESMWVAVIGFSLNFGAYVSEILRSGIESIDGGQREAALALGYSENQAFFHFIFPQAASRQLPVYRGEIISLLKNTSVVGYIAIQDLTKMSDIIRSRTYEAFFPLIVTAIIYFILAWIISIILQIILKKMDPKTKKRTVKGVTVK